VPDDLASCAKALAAAPAGQDGTKQEAKSIASPWRPSLRKRGAPAKRSKPIQRQKIEVSAKKEKKQRLRAREMLLHGPSV